jgi:hypothetical protein
MIVDKKNVFVFLELMHRIPVSLAWLVIPFVEHVVVPQAVNVQIVQPLPLFLFSTQRLTSANPHVESTSTKTDSYLTALNVLSDATLVQVPTSALCAIWRRTRGASSQSNQDLSAPAFKVTTKIL